MFTNFPFHLILYLFRLHSLNNLAFKSYTSLLISSNHGTRCLLINFCFPLIRGITSNFTLLFKSILLVILSQPWSIKVLNLFKLVHWWFHNLIQLFTNCYSFTLICHSNSRFLSWRDKLLPAIIIALPDSIRCNARLRSRKSQKCTIFLRLFMYRVEILAFTSNHLDNCLWVLPEWQVNPLSTYERRHPR